jgi:peptidoglycan/xylan/chitin deacetylase (PgdA/CDA1 family)
MIATLFLRPVLMEKGHLVMAATDIRLAVLLCALLLAGGLASGGCNAALPSTSDNANEGSETSSQDDHADTDHENANASSEDEDGSGVEEFTLYVNAQVDAELEDTEGLNRIVGALQERDLATTIYITAEYAHNHQWSIHDFFLDGFEIALHGYSSGEDLTGMSYEDQRDLLTQALHTLEGCQPCGTYKAVKGFRPQSFRQNEDTHCVLDELAFVHNSGFKAGELYVDGHQQDAVPYPVDEHSFHAVPVTVVEYGGKRIHLCDTACALDEGMTGDQWAEALQIGLDQANDRQVPVVVIFHGWYTGDVEQYDYWQPFVDFLDDVTAEGGLLVTTQELVSLYAD